MEQPSQFKKLLARLGHQVDDNAALVRGKALRAIPYVDLCSDRRDRLRFASQTADAEK
jgi:hypothetical protein